VEVLNPKFFLAINVASLAWVLYFFLSVMIFIGISIITFSFYKRKMEMKKLFWQEKVVTIISESLLIENDENPVWLQFTEADKELLKDEKFRQYFIGEIIHAKKNFSGASVLNLKHLYQSLDFDKDAVLKMKSHKWHIKASGIHELAVMGQEQYVKEIFRLTNDVNELVRNEAQCALVNFYGFKGLRFLNVIIYPISQWQQIQLLNYIYDVHAADPKRLTKWLLSKNNSVVIFAIRLASLCNCTEVYTQIIRCLQGNESQVKQCALEYLKKINHPDSAEEIINCYAGADAATRLIMLSVLQETGTENQIPFLINELSNPDNTIKLAAAKTLSVLHPSGPSFFHSHSFAGTYPWNAIFNQIENERAA
jgi:hypothetical protein